MNPTSISVIRHHFHQHSIHLIGILCMHPAPSSVILWYFNNPASTFYITILINLSPKRLAPKYHVPNQFTFIFVALDAILVEPKCLLCCWTGILLTRTRIGVEALISFIKEIPQLKRIVYPAKLVGQGRKEGTMTDVEQENTLRLFRLGSSLVHSLKFENSNQLNKTFAVVEYVGVWNCWN